MSTTQQRASNRPAIVTPESLATDYAHLVNAADAFTLRAAHDVPPVVEDDDDLALITAYVKDVREERKRVAGIGDGEKRPYLDAHKTLHAWFNQLWQRLGELQDAVEARGNAYLEKKRKDEQRHREEIERKAKEEAEKARIAALEAAKIAAEKEAAAAKPEVPLLAKQEEEQAKASAATALDTFAQANTAAAEATRATAAKASDMSRTRTAAGTATLGETVTFTFDQEKLDLEMLRPFLRKDELEAAIRAVMRKRKAELDAGTLVIKGVVFKRETKGRYT